MSAFTVGVEEEYQLVDPVTGALQSRAQAVLSMDWSGELRTELQESTIEIGSMVCDSSAALRDELRRLRTQAAAAAAAQDLRIVAAGVHPFSEWRGHRISAGDRYARMAETYGRIARDEHNFAMHIHVAVDGERMPLFNMLRYYIPHLTALAGSSPYFEGEDTVYASYRMVLWRRWPGAGPPPRLESDAEYRHFVEHMLRTGAMGDERNLYWTIRPHSTYPTLEFRMCDVCPNLGDALAIAALTRTLVAAAAEGFLPGMADGSWSPAALDAVLEDDCWRAAKDGLRARFVNPSRAGEAETARDSVLRLIDAVVPVAEQLGEAQALEGVTKILERGTGADRLRAFVASRDDLVRATHWLAAETLVGTATDRRASLREMPEYV